MMNWAEILPLPRMLHRTETAHSLGRKRELCANVKIDILEKTTVEKGDGQGRLTHVFQKKSCKRIDMEGKKPIIKSALREREK